MLSPADARACAMVEGSLTDVSLPALIFDCDGVLIDSEYLASRVESEQLHALGIELGVDEAHALFLGKTVDGVLDAIAARSGNRPGAAWVYNWAFATAHAFERELEAVRGIGAALQVLQERRYRMAVASQSPLARVQLSLQVTGLAGHFGRHLYVSSMVPRPKPAPDVYLLAAEKLGAAPAIASSSKTRRPAPPPRAARECGRSVMRPATRSARCRRAAPR